MLTDEEAGELMAEDTEIDIPIKHESKPYLMIPFPDGATNGDMIKALLEGDVLMTTKKTVGYKIHSLKDGYIQWFDKDWWNASYKRGESE